MERHGSPKLSQSKHPLSLNIHEAANTPLPPSSPARNQSHSPRNVSSPAFQRPTPSPLRRSSSSMSFDRRAESPALGRRTSLASLRNGESPVSSPKLLNRRSSSNLLMSALAPAVEEPPPPTASSIAANHIALELAHHADSDVQHPKTLVVLHDSCYGHRFARPRTKQGDLNLVVERPERIRAGAMGVATAYVRLGERHAGGRNPPHPRRQPATQIPFRIHKTSRMVGLESEAVVAVHGKELMRELQNMCDNAGTKLANTGREVERDDKDKRSFHTGDLYLCTESLQAFQGALGGVCDAVDAVFEGVKSGKGPSQAFVCIRPPGHHCSSDYPSGFCWLNNVHIGIQHAIQQHGLTHAAIIDFDLHHGDGSQEIAWGRNEQMFYPEKPAPLAKRPFIGYYSLHDINSFPCEGGDREKVQNASLCIDNAHGQSIWNIHLHAWRTVDEFWSLYETRYKVLLDKARAFLNQQTEERSRAKGNQRPKAAIFISAGFDASEHEGGGMQRHKVNVPTEFYARFTKDIVALAQENGTSVDGRVISVLEGGYSNKALISGILSHISGLCDGSENVVDEETQLVNGMAGIGLSGLAPAGTASIETSMRYNTEWWHPSNLDILDQLLNPTPIAPAAPNSRKVRLATYSSPTHASTMKAVDPNRVNLNYRVPSSQSPSRAASPPPPDVDWQTAASELAHLLIPSDRETRSHTATQLTEPRVKKERNSAAGPEAVVVPGPPAGGRTLRDRKPKAASPPVNEKITAQRKASADRRKTIAEVLPKSDDMPIAREPRRRTSIASTISTTSVATNATTATARPRVTKSMSNGLDVKKTRIAGPQPAASRPTVPQRASSAIMIKKEEPLRSESASNDVMDDLTSGIKRITIKVPSSEEYAARQKKGTAVASKVSSAAKPPGAAPTTKKAPPKSTSAIRANTSTTAPKKVPVAGARGVKQATSGAQNGDPSVKKEIVSPASEMIQPPFGGPSYPVPQTTANIQVATGLNGNAEHTVYPPSTNGYGSSSSELMPQYPVEKFQQALESSLPNPSVQQQYSELQWLAPNSDPALPKQAEPPKQQQQRVPPSFSATGFIPFHAHGQEQQPE
jgi:histone deacetylase HOS3